MPDFTHYVVALVPEDGDDVDPSTIQRSRRGNLFADPSDADDLRNLLTDEGIEGPWGVYPVTVAFGPRMADEFDEEEGAAPRR